MSSFMYALYTWFLRIYDSSLWLRGIRLSICRDLGTWNFGLKRSFGNLRHFSLCLSLSRKFVTTGGKCYAFILRRFQIILDELSETREFRNNFGWHAQTVLSSCWILQIIGPTTDIFFRGLLIRLMKTITFLWGFSIRLIKHKCLFHKCLFGLVHCLVGKNTSHRRYLSINHYLPLLTHLFSKDREVI